MYQSQCSISANAKCANENNSLLPSLPYTNATASPATSRPAGATTRPAPDLTLAEGAESVPEATLVGTVDRDVGFEIMVFRRAELAVTRAVAEAAELATELAAVKTEERKAGSLALAPRRVALA